MEEERLAKEELAIRVLDTLGADLFVRQIIGIFENLQPQQYVFQLRVNSAELSITMLAEKLIP